MTALYPTNLPSRRQDLLVGALVSTFIVYLSVYISLRPDSRVPIPPPVDKVPPTKPFELPRDIEIADPVAAAQSAADRLSPPDIPDQPAPYIKDSFVTPLELPHPAGPDVKAIPVTWSLPSGPIQAIFDPASLDQQPTAQFQPRPVYPMDMRRDGMSGSVVVDFIVDTQGNVRNARAIRSSNRSFEEPAVSAVSKWKFSAGRKGGHAVFTHMQVPIEFNIDSRP